MTVGVIAVDPSSRITRGALLGDRIRMRTDPEDQGVFVRSLAARGQLGGLAELAFPAVILMRAIYDRVIVETVGVGQSEADISTVADTVVLCVQPGSGDSLQFMKAGIMEIPDIAMVTKADMGPPARRALADLKGALGLASGGDVACLIAVRSQRRRTGRADSGLPTSASRILLERRSPTASRPGGRLAALSLLQRFGREGLATIGQAIMLPDGAAPFGTLPQNCSESQSYPSSRFSDVPRPVADGLRLSARHNLFCP